MTRIGAARPINHKQTFLDPGLPSRRFMEPAPESQPSLNRGRGRGNRGGLGKYLRARGRGHRGGGRPAVFTQRLLLEGEGAVGEEDEEAKAEREEREAKFRRRQLGTNADRYKEEEPELDSDGEPIVEPEVDLATFLEKQRITDVKDPGPQVDDDDIDTSLAHISSAANHSKAVADKKGKVHEIEWDRGLEEMIREKAAAEAQWELKSRFKAKSEKLKAKPVFKSSRDRQAEKYEQAPELPQEKPKTEESKSAEMEAFLDDLLG